MTFKKILVANRGEIAIRVMRACREMKIQAVTIFSQADRSSKHVRYADEAYEIGAPPAVDSYLRIDRIIDVAKKSGCQAIHPGYGFLAENHHLPKACEDEGIAFIGPSSDAMALVGDKTEARKTIEKAGIPIIPGTKEPIKNLKQAEGLAEQMGYPILLKAAGGGGGKGMRVVERPNDLSSSFERATGEAKSSFGNPDIYIEKYLIKPRHVEIQILADKYGNIIHLNERECSVQRRYQKLIEESPSPIVDRDMRNRMGEAAKKAISAANYTNAGTVEFLVDQDRNFYFLEVNARLQVEHPVTELITGIDLVKHQIAIAAGDQLKLSQEDIGITGAAIECRISAEDPVTFLPSTGRIVEMIEPAGPGVRVESGIYGGYEVPLYYDPLIAKVITWGRDRNEALERMRRALEEYKIKGIKTTIPFHRRVLYHPPFIAGDYHTGIVNEIEPKSVDDHIDIGAIAATIVAMAEERIGFKVTSKRTNYWKLSGRISDGLHRQ